MGTHTHKLMERIFHSSLSSSPAKLLNNIAICTNPFSHATPPFSFTKVDSYKFPSRSSDPIASGRKMVALSDMEGEKKVMVAIDETDASYHALIWVLDNLKEALPDTPLLIFAAVPEPNYSHYLPASFSPARLYAMASPAPEVAISVQEHKKKVMLGLLDKAKRICTSHGVESETILETGDAKLAICDAVENLEISMLILRDEGLGRIQRALVGSVSDHCLQHAKCSVLVVKRP